MAKVIYNYHGSTGEFYGESNAMRSPADKEEIYIIPANATEIEPPEKQDGFARVFDIENQQWSQVEDNRGKTYYNENRAPVFISDLGPVGEGLTPDPAPFTNDELWDQIRVKRGDLLTASDWTQIPDNALTDDQKTAWAEYRTALRDMVDTSQNATEVVWPVPPQQ